MGQKTITIELDLAALPAGGVETFVGNPVSVKADEGEWSGFVTEARLEDDGIRLIVQAVETDTWTQQAD
jgi:hypothetical protein